MLCKKCCHCGLCPGENHSASPLQVELKNEVKAAFNCDSSLPVNYVGIAFDIGTTTIACSLFCLANGKELFSFGEENKQTEYGTDVVSRISFALGEGGFAKLSRAVKGQLCSMTKNAMLNCQAVFSSMRRGRPELKKIVIAGNTAMESFVAGVPVKSIAAFPFTMESYFGFEKSAAEVFAHADFLYGDCKVYFAPAISAYVGGDIVCAMVASGFLNDDGKIKFLADIGTNCEMCVKDAGGKITCTSTSAGPAFEGYGIECGSPAGTGSIAKVFIDADKKVLCSVIGGGVAANITGTGIISAVSEFLKSDFISRDGEVKGGIGKINLTDKVYLSQKDIRNFQLAKGSVFCGLKILAGKIKPFADALLFLAGGFGTKIDVAEAVNVKMIPQELGKNVAAMGNGSLAGASLLLLDESLRKSAETLARTCTALDLSNEAAFQNEFIKALDF